MALDLLLRQGRRADEEAPVDIAIAGGRIVEIAGRIAADAPEERLDGRLVIAGFVDSHIHLDKSCILDRCHCEQGTLEEAIAAVATAKRAFTEADIYARAQRTLEKAIIQGTTRMRTHVEIDPRVGLKGFHAVRRLKRDYEWAIDLQICAFPQEGLTNDPGAEELLVQACEQGADVIGGCPYTDTDPPTQIARIFEVARRFDLDIDFHLDFDIDPSWMHLDEVCRQNRCAGMGWPRCGRSRHQAFRHRSFPPRRDWAAPGRRRRRSDGVAGDRFVPDGAGSPAPRAPRRRARASAAP